MFAAILLAGLTACTSVADNVAAGVAAPSAEPSAGSSADGSDSPSAAPGWEGTSSPSPGGPTGTTGGSSGSGATASPTAAVQGSFEATFSAGAAIITLQGHSCDLAGGRWDGDIAIGGGGTGGAPISFTIPLSKDGAKVSWTFDGTFEGEAATYEISGNIFRGGPPDAPKLQLFGTLLVRRGKQEATGPANATGAVSLGPVAECG